MTLALAGTAALVGWWMSRSERPESVVTPREAVKRTSEAPPRVSPLELRLADLAAVSGVVKDTEGREIAGATVCAGSDWRELNEREREERVCVLSEADGSYRVEGLLAVPHFVYASAAGFVPGRSREVVTLRVGEELVGVEVVLLGGGVELKGAVRDASGGAIEGALVTVEYAEVRSGIDGSFALWVAPGTVFVSARAEGYAPERVQGVAPNQVLTISLVPAVENRGALR